MIGRKTVVCARAQLQAGERKVRSQCFSCNYTPQTSVIRIDSKIACP